MTWTKEQKKISDKKWRQSKKGKASDKKYRNSENGKIAARRSNKKQRKLLVIIMHNLKINGCAICGYDKCDNALEFHHSNSKNKLFSLTVRKLSSSNDKVALELNKCILLCANCHRELHNQR